MADTAFATRWQRRRYNTGPLIGTFVAVNVEVLGPDPIEIGLDGAVDLADVRCVMARVQGWHAGEDAPVLDEGAVIVWRSGATTIVFDVALERLDQELVRRGAVLPPQMSPAVR